MLHSRPAAMRATMNLASETVCSGSLEQAVYVSAAAERPYLDSALLCECIKERLWDWSLAKQQHSSCALCKRHAKTTSSQTATARSMPPLVGSTAGPETLQGRRKYRVQTTAASTGTRQKLAPWPHAHNAGVAWHLHNVPPGAQ